jgi:CP family cyanate transporter-like MFS transporter
MIIERTGDLLRDDAQALVNPVNTTGVMGKGLALQFKRAFPANFTAYAEACADGRLRPGKVLAVPIDAGRWALALRGRRAPAAPAPAPRGEGTLLRSPIAWYVAAFMGLTSLMFYVLMSWLPEIMRDAGFAPAAAGMMVSVMMIVGIPLGFAVPVFAARLRDQRPVIAGVAVTMAAGLAGLLLAPSAGWAWAVVLGIGTGSAFPLAYTLLSLRSPSPSAAAGLSGMAQTGGYLLAGAGPLAVGVLHDATGGWHVPIVLLLALLVPEIVFGLLAARPGYVRPAAPRPRPEKAPAALEPAARTR